MSLMGRIGPIATTRTRWWALPHLRMGLMGRICPIATLIAGLGLVEPVRPIGSYSGTASGRGSSFREARLL